MKKYIHAILLCLFICQQTIANESQINDAKNNMPKNNPKQLSFNSVENIEENRLSIIGRRVNLVGDALSASQGVINQQEIEIRPLLRTGEILELVPGMVVTQHSGSGKANQYFLRGFNLDHGTDFATYIDNMPVNMRTHGHGQGYTDINFVIPELIKNISYKKGPYYAEIGDFSGAGSAEMTNAKFLEQGTFTATTGSDNYFRMLVMDSVNDTKGNWVYALERTTADGPWTDIDENLDKINAVVKRHGTIANGDYSVTLMAYDNSWNSADQIPQRAVTQNLIDRYGSIDKTLAGSSSRYSLSADWMGHHWQFSSYIIRYRLNLLGNFTYFLDDPINGDQMEQVDDRWIMGGKISYQSNATIAGKDMANRYGIETRTDDIKEVGLYKTQQSQRRGAVRSDTVNEMSVGVFWENEIDLTDNLRSIIGVRYDYYNFDVNSLITENIHNINLTPNNGKADDGLTSTKASLVYTIDNHFEIYGSAGQGFHSNDARGTTLQIDPNSGNNMDSVTPLVASLGGEFGLRAFWENSLNLSASLWFLKLDSELLFVGDSGSTEASGKSKRKGIEVTAYYHMNEHWTADIEFAQTDSKLSDENSNNNQLPGAIDKVIQFGLSANFDNGFFGSLRLRYFGERPLEESGLFNSDSSSMVNIRAGYQWDNWKLKADILNLLDSNDHDIDYYYESKLASETAPVEDYHFHPVEPRGIRISLDYQF